MTPCRLAVLLAPLLVAGCSDYDVNIDGKDPDPFDDTPDTPVDTDTQTGTGEEEACNGLDDDGDGAVDEDFPDADGDGRADCLEESCPSLALSGADTLPVDDECASGPTLPEAPVIDPWTFRVDWTHVPSEPSLHTGTTPSIGNLDDDNGDGRVDEDDFPDVISISGSSQLVVLDGRDGSFKWSLPSACSVAVPVIADVDVDGLPDLIYIGPDRKVVAVDGTGAEKWQSTESAATCFSIQVADLDGDGTVEVIAEDLVVDGADGGARFRMDTPLGPWITNAVADIDLDGDQEILRAGVLYDSDGTVVWETGIYGVSNDYAMVVQADADREAELAIVTNRLRVYDTDGTLLTDSAYFRDVSSTTGFPCAADFDGDGAMEVAVPVYTEGPFVMMELDGRVVWEDYGPSRSLAAGCSGYDFDGDGAVEIVYPADEALYVYDGATGAVRMSWDGHASPTIVEYAVVADVDADDHAEIVFISIGSGIPYSMTALGHAGEGWPAAGRTWSDSEFHLTAVRADGSVPTRPDPAWLTHGVYRARTALDGDPGAPDLVASITDVCVASCTDGPVEVAVSVGNQGGASVDAGALLALYAIDAVGERLVATVTLPALPPGERLEGFAVALSPEDIGEQGFRVAIDDDGAGAGDWLECDEENNDEEWRDVLCP